MKGGVLHIDTGLEWRGGQQQVYLLHRELLRRGVESRLLAREAGALARRCREEGLPVQWVRGRRPWVPGVLSGTLRASRGVGVVHAHDGHAAALGLLAVTLRPGTCLVCHRRVSYPLGRGPLARWRYRRADAWVAVSSEIGALLRNAGLPGDKVRVIHSALDVVAFRARARVADGEKLRESLGIAPSAPIIGFCAAYSPQKGHSVLVEAAPLILKEVPRAVFLLPGDGLLLAEIRDRVRLKGLGRSFVLPGFRSDSAELTSLFTVGVVPSVDGEGSSASVKEPMVLGVPAAVSDLGGNLEVVGDAGVPFRTKDPGDLARAVLLLLKDSALRVRLGESARRRAEAFSVETMADAVLALYGDLEGGR